LTFIATKDEECSALVVKVTEAWMAEKKCVGDTVGVPVENTRYWGDNER
jgi:hypothetical protein